MRALKANKAVIDVNQWEKWSVESFIHLVKCSPVNNGRAVVSKVCIRGGYDEENRWRFFMQCGP